jgi:hypothetical protein
MAIVTSSHGLADELVSGDHARILLVNKELQDLFDYRAMLLNQGCQV